MRANEVIQRARTILQDADSDYWTEDELPKWLTDGRMEAYALRPDLYQVTEDIRLQEGALQTLPDGSRRLFGVIQNVSHAKQRQITVTDGLILSRHRPSWRTGRKSAEILHYIYDDIRGHEFEVYPPAREEVDVRISYAKVPASIDTAASTLELTEEGELASVLVDYVLYRAFLKEADTVPAYHDRAAAHYTKFQSVLTGAIAAKAETSPNQG